jgi:hypothetical protein
VVRGWDDDQLRAEIGEVCTDYSAHGHTDPFAQANGSTTNCRGEKPVDEMTETKTNEPSSSVVW